MVAFRDHPPPAPAVGRRPHRCLVLTRPTGLPAWSPPVCEGSRPPPTPSPSPGRQESGPVRGLCQVLFYSVPTETPGEGAASGTESRHSGGAVRHGTARYGTVQGHYGWHRAQQTRTPSQCSEGAHPASHLPLERAPGARPPSAPRLDNPPAPSPSPALPGRLPQLGLGARPGRVGYRPPVPAGREARWRMCSGGETGPGGGGRSQSRVRCTHCTRIYSARSSGGRRPGGGTLGRCTCHRWERRQVGVGPGLSSVGLPHGSTTLPLPIPQLPVPPPSLGHW